MNAIYTWRTIKILEKGYDMKLSELNYLLRRGVEEKDIAKTLDMDPKSEEFKKLIYNARYMGKHSKKRKLNLTTEEYINLRKKGLEVREIARIKNVKHESLQCWKSRHGIRDKDLVAQGILPKTCLTRGAKR
ncbi:hypothetical protein P9G49_03965 [Heyndrickxia coagulans]|uniref:hypothetical protein n=1 Tax=Heyndrickxia coagulans TaxID=1398 RepID=UPI002DF94E08|nr:hypothetical protein [Heyndrickxia coagulans]